MELSRSSLLSTTKKILNAREIKPIKGLGQNFLVDQSAIHKLVATSGITSHDTVLEIGSGLGVLTQELAKQVKKVVAVEKDQKMVDILRDTFVSYKNVEIIHDDALQLEPNKSYLLVLGDKDSSGGFGETQYLLNVSDDEVELEALMSMMGGGFP